MDMLSLITGVEGGSNVKIFEESPGKKKADKNKEKEKLSIKDKRDKIEILINRFTKANENVEKALTWLDKNEEKLKEEEKEMIFKKLEKGVEIAKLAMNEINKLLQTNLKIKDMEKIKEEIGKFFNESGDWDF